MRNVHENTRETKRKCEYKEIESDCHVCRLCAISFYFVGCGAVSATEWWCWYFCYFFIVLHCQSDGLHFILCCMPIVYIVRVHIRKGVDDYCWFIGFSTICIFFSQFWWNIWFLLPSTNTHRILRLQMTLKMCLSVCFFDAVCVPESMMIKLSRHTI